MCHTQAPSTNKRRANKNIHADHKTLYSGSSIQTVMSLEMIQKCQRNQSVKNKALMNS